jgi:hypothetical protein
VNGIKVVTAGVLLLARAGNFPPLLSVQTGSEAHSASYSMSTGGVFPAGKAAGA